MSTATQDFEVNPSIATTNDMTIGQRLTRFGEHAMVVSTVTVLAWIGAMKFTAYEAEAIQGLVASSPLTSWMYNLFSLQGASNLIRTIEIIISVMLLVGIRYKPVAVLGALGAIATFTVTLSYLFTAPGWEASLGGFPALSVVPGQFLLKDFVLLAVAIWLLGKALTRKS